MKMKQLLRYTSTIMLRTALLLGVIAFVNTQIMAQPSNTYTGEPVHLTSDMPDAFEAKTPGIDDGQYYFIQFYEEIVYAPYLFQSFLGEVGDNAVMHAMDYLPYAANRQWTLVGVTGSNTKFKLKSKRGFYAKRRDDGFFITTSDASQATEFERIERGSFRPGFCELRVSNGINIGRRYGNTVNSEWQDMVSVGNDNAHGKVRFVKLKANAAHIIYYRGEHADGYDNSQFRAQENTTRHYLTYSGTDTNHSEWNFRSSTVSSRQSIIPKDKSIWTLPTAAAYHQDGLWALEETGNDGEFFIKKHGTENYLVPIHDDFDYLNLGDKNNASRFSLEDPLANRYSRVQSIQEVTKNLADEPFYNWNGYGADAQKTSDTPATVDYNVGNNVTLTENQMVAGTSWVDCQTFADLSSYSKMIITGTPGMRLRVLMSRQYSNSGPLVEKNVTIGDDRKAEVDLTNLTLNTTNTSAASVRMTYIDGSDGTLDADGNNLPDNVDTPHWDVTSAVGGYNSISNGEVVLGQKSWGVNNIIYLQVDASYIPGKITKATLKATATGSTDGRRATQWGAGFNGTAWRNDMTWNTADRSITDLTPESRVWVDANATQEISLDITGAFTNDLDKIATILVYELQAAGGTFSNPTVEIEYSPSVSYAHLNAIKTGYGDFSGTIDSITLTQNSSDSYLHHADGDGWQAMLWPGEGANHWYAAFYPVEVPASQKDEFFQVRLVLNPPYAGAEGKVSIPIGEGMSTDGMTRALLPGVNANNIIGAKYTPSDTYKNCFKIENLAVPSGYDRIVVRFGSEVHGDWQINGVYNGHNGSGPNGGSFTSIPENSMYYEMDLRLDPTDATSVVSSVTEFSIFNGAGQCQPLTIAEVYFYKGSMISNETGGAIRSSEANPSLWELEQVDNYTQFRLKNPDTGKYLAGNHAMTQPNDPYGEAYDNAPKAELNPNNKFWEDFTVKWYIPKQTNITKEIRVNHYVRHRESYLRTYASAITNQELLKKQGLAFNDDPEWETTTGDLDGFRQKTNHFEITHYLKKGSSRVIEFPTVLNRNNDHIYFQRFFHYNEIDEGAEGTGMDLDNLKAHVSLDTRDDGDVQYFLYNNGMVTGQKLDWRTYNSDTETYADIPDGGMARNEQRRFNFTNSDGESFTVAVDVSRYSDLQYLNTPDHLDGDLREPSLTMRYLFYMNDAKTMAKKLTACPEGGSKWLEEKTFHFGRTQVPYTKFKKVGYRGEFLPVRHVFSDYWVYDDPQLIDDSYLASLGLSGDALNNYLDEHLVSAVTSNTSGKIEVEIIPGATGIRRGGYNANLGETALRGYGDDDTNENNYQCFYYYDLLSPNIKHEYGNSRFIVFRYPENGIVDTDEPAYINVYLNAGNNQRYQLAQYTIYFDANMATRPWTKINNGTHYANGIDMVKGTNRDPKNLRAKAGHPIAKVTFDYPTGNTYHFPTVGQTRHDGGVREPNGTIDNSSPVPLTFGHTNYAFDGDGCNWGSYALVTQKRTIWGNNKIVLPADDDTHGYGLPADEGMQKAFMYIDASEQPGDICAVDFEGEFCPDDHLMCSGWISGSNKIQNDDRCPGSITITVKGEDADGNTKTIYRFCPGQIYELDNGYGDVGEKDDDIVAEMGAGIDGNGNGATHVVWQQFYFEFSTDQRYERYWLEVNNNCVSSNGGDFMLDNVEVYTIVPEVTPDINTPLCVSVDENGETVTDMRLLKLTLNYNKLMSSRTLETSDPNKDTAEEGFVFLEKKKFLETFRTGLQSWVSTMDLETKQHYGIDDINFSNITLEALADTIAKGRLAKVPTDEGSAYKTAFDAAILGNRTTWHSDAPTTNMNASIMYFRWKKLDFETPGYVNMPQFSFVDAVNRQHSVYYEVVNTDEGQETRVVMNGNYPGLQWKANTDYYVINTNATFNESDDPDHPGNPCEAFNLCSECTKFTEFRIEPPLELLGLSKSEDSNDYVVCEGQIPTILLDLKGFDVNGVEIPMKDINFDWWLGNSTTKATLDNYHIQQKNGVRLDDALSTLRIYYPDVTDLNGVMEHIAVSPGHALTVQMLAYLQELVDAGELVLHQKSINIPAEPTSTDDPYFYLVACPIHDDSFVRALNPAENQYVAFYCDEPQEVRVKVGEKAPTLKTGFVPGEHGFDTYEYDFPEGTDPVLSIRLAKAAQFETVKNTEVEATGGVLSTDVNYLWLPIRNAQTQTAPGVIRKADDDNIYLASTNDPTWDKQIYTSMSKTGSLPVVGRIVQLEAINTRGETEGTSINLDDQNDVNRLCVYFTENFEVREGYNYTLSLPFKEQPDGDGNEVNTCDGTILINLKIVPDYEVWTGAAGNEIPDWNNDENWRRADGNPANSGLNQDELYVGAATADSPLNGYKTNEWNYRTPKDRVFRKGFAPLYCTHVLMMSDEWGNAPVLYDALDYNPDDQQHKFTNEPFPNLRDTSTPILKFDMQARRYDMWNDTYGVDPDRGNSNRPNDLIAEMYQINSCDEIVFQPGTELRNAHLLNYNNAWVEYKLDNKRWYLLGSPLQGTIAGEWYAPTGTAQQKTTYYDPVTFGEGYDRYSPAIYQRSWDKAKAVLYEVGANYSTTDNPDDEDLNAVLGSEDQGIWSSGSWNTAGADDYLDRLGYKPLGGNKANVAIQGIWSNTYNDATVDYTKGGFSVMVMNHLKGNDTSGGTSIIRLPKEDTMYDYYRFSETGAVDGGTDTDLSGVRDALNRAKNRGRLKTDLLLPENENIQKTEAAASIYGDKRTYTRIPIKETALATMMGSLNNTYHTEKVPVGVSDLGFYLVENPFTCGLNMEKFFEENPGLEKKYWLLRAGGQQLVQWVEETGWITPDVAVVTDGDPNDETTYEFAAAKGILAPGQGFFVQAVTPATPPTEPVKTVDIKFTRSMQAQSRYGVESGSRTFNVVVGQAQQMEELKELVDHDNNPETPDVLQTVYIDVDLNGNGVYGETGVVVDGQTVDEKEPVMVPVYETNSSGEYVLDADGNRIPVLVDVTEDVTLYNYVQDTTEGHEFTLQAPTRSINALDLGLVITAQRGNMQSSALVIRRDGASNDFLPSEDTETFITSDLQNVPTVYTLCGRLATTINSIRDFRSLPIGVESSSDAPCTLTFNGVELLGDSISFYDAVERKLTPLQSGMKLTVSGQTQNRYYLVHTLIQEEAAEETHLQVFIKGKTVKVIASTDEPILSVSAYNVGGSQVHTASPQAPEYSFDVPSAGVYLIKAETESDHKVIKVIAR